MKGGGTNFDAKIRRNSTDNEDLFIAHIGAMDVMARALEAAAAILERISTSFDVESTLCFV
jgi:xylose isomerase